MGSMKAGRSVQHAKNTKMQAMISSAKTTVWKMQRCWERLLYWCNKDLIQGRNQQAYEADTLFK